MIHTRFTQRDRLNPDILQNLLMMFVKRKWAVMKYVWCRALWKLTDCACVCSFLCEILCLVTNYWCFLGRSSLGLTDRFHTEPSLQGQLSRLRSDRHRLAETHSPGESHRTPVQTAEQQQHEEWDRAVARELTEAVVVMRVEKTLSLVDLIKKPDDRVTELKGLINNWMVNCCRGV